MAFPTSDMPGHKVLRERIDDALDRTMEAANIDFKQSASWNTLKWTIVKTVLGMANLRDGGLIIIGVSESGATWQLDGISQDNLDSYEADTMTACFEKYISPVPPVEAVFHQRDGKSYLALDVGNLQEAPHICKKGGPEGKGLDQGGFYHRPLGGVPRTERVHSAEDMRPIIQVAAEAGARKIVEQAQRVGTLGPAERQQTDADRFDAELGNL